MHEIFTGKPFEVKFTAPLSSITQCRRTFRITPIHAGRSGTTPRASTDTSTLDLKSTGPGFPVKIQRSFPNPFTHAPCPGKDSDSVVKSCAIISLATPWRCESEACVWMHSRLVGDPPKRCWGIAAEGWFEKSRRGLERPFNEVQIVGSRIYGGRESTRISKAHKGAGTRYVKS